MKNSNKNWLNPRVQIINSTIHGKGMFAISKIKEGETLIIWRDCYTNKIGAFNAKKQGKGIMQWDDDIFSYENDENQEDYSINHSCDPNSWMSDAYTIIARKNIEKEEEITIDYALWETDEDNISTWNCNCGSKLCRGKVTGKDWRNKNLQKLYKGHFSPLLNKRIENLKG